MLEKRNPIIAEWMPGKRWEIPLFENVWNASDDGKNGREKIRSEKAN